MRRPGSATAIRLLLAGLWWRRGLAVSVLLVGAITVTAAALGPLYARAAAESILQDHLIQAGPATGLRLTDVISPGNGNSYPRFVDRVHAVGRVHGYRRQVNGFFTPTPITVYVPRPLHGQLKTFLLWRGGQCAHVVVVAGHCPTAPDEAMASERSVAGVHYGMHVGARVALSPFATAETSYGTTLPTPHAVHVVGIYRPRNVADPFWFGQNYFGAHGGQIGKALLDTPTIDPLLVTRSTFLRLPINNSVEADVDYLLTPGAVRLGNVRAERQRVAGILEHQSHRDVHAESGLLPVLQSAAREHRLIDVGTLLVTLQLTLLAWLVLFHVVGNAIDARGDEIALAKLRGYRSWATIRFGLGEPVTLLALAVPIGLVAAYALTHAFASAVLVKGIPIAFTRAAVWTALVAFAGGLVAVSLAAHRTLTRSVLDQWRHTERRPANGRVLLAADVGLACAAVAGLVLLLRTGRAQSAGNTSALLAPALLVFATGIVGVRLLPFLCRKLAAGTRATRRLGVFLASSQISRRAVGLRLAALLAVAVGLATFGVAGETVTSSNRGARADAEVGAAQTAAVQFAPGLDPLRATHVADPDGRWAMATATWLPNGGLSVVGTVLGVDSGRFAAVTEPVRNSPHAAVLARAILGRPVPPVMVTAGVMRVRVTAAGLRGDALPVLQLDLRSAHQPFLTAEGPPIRPGTRSYEVRVPCAHECLFRGITWDRPIGADRPLSGTLTVTGLATRSAGGWRSVDLQLGNPQSWYPAKPQGQATDRPQVTSHGVVDRFRNRNGGYGGIVYGSDPLNVPAVASPHGLVRPSELPSVPRMADSDGVTARFTLVRRVPLLPEVLDGGVLMNLRYLEDELPGFAGDATWSVWVGPDAPHDWRARLGAAGLQVVTTQSRADRSARLARQAPALALLLLLVCALAGAVLAVGGTAISISASSRRRSYELAALRVVGVSRSALLRASLLEHLLLLGAAVILGVPAGYIAARLTMPIIPEFADHTPVPLTYTPHAAPTLAFAAAFVVLLVITALIAARALIRVAVPARLREAE